MKFIDNAVFAIERSVSNEGVPNDADRIEVVEKWGRVPSCTASVRPEFAERGAAAHVLLGRANNLPTAQRQIEQVQLLLRCALCKGANQWPREAIGPSTLSTCKLPV